MPNPKVPKLHSCHQFGFRSLHSTVLQGYRVVDVIASFLELLHYCTSAVLDVEKAFDRVLYEGVLSKLKGILLFTYNRFFQISRHNALSSIYPMLAGVVCFLGLYLDKRLTWNRHTRLKRKDLNRRYRLLMRLSDNRSQSQLTINC